MSKQCKSLGSAATLAAFLGLSPPDMVQVQPAKFNVKSKTKGPNVRCLERTSGVVIEVGGCDSVEKVYRVLSVHMVRWYSVHNTRMEYFLLHSFLCYFNLPICT